MNALPLWWSRNLKDIERCFQQLVEKCAWDAAEIHAACELARKTHESQTRKGDGGPYIIHPLRVAITLAEELDYRDPELIKAALLHDVLEDGTGAPANIEHFGVDTRSVVEALTRRSDEHRGGRADQPHSPYLIRIRQGGESAVAVKFADRLDNLRESRYLGDPDRWKLYVEETYRAYLPLLDVIQVAARRNRLEQILLNFLSAQPGRPRAEHLQALAAHVDHVLGSRAAGSAPVEAIADRQRALAVSCLLNPALRTWIEDDGITVTRVPLTSAQLATRVCSRLAALIRGDSLGELLALAGIPSSYANADVRPRWQKVVAQLTTIHGWLSSDDCPAWFAELKTDRNLPWLLVLIQSRLFLPASWTFPLWHPDFGADLSSSLAEVHSAFAVQPEDSARWRGMLQFLLTNRLALHRFLAGTGTRNRLDRPAEIGRTVGVPPRTLWALRLSGECLELCTAAQTARRASSSDNELIRELEALWLRVQDQPFGPDAAVASRKGCLDATALGLERDAFSGIEWDGLAETRRLFEGRDLGGLFGTLLKVLARCERDSNAGTNWISFDSTEWEKREPFWSRAGAFTIEVGTPLDELELRGVRLVRHDLQGLGVLRVLPARSFALRDRLRETTDEDLDRIARGGFSAVALFDQLLLSKVNASEVTHLWVPRVYRVLDSLEDLDPAGVQTITVRFLADEPVPSFRAFLPLPANPEESARQNERKDLIARYIVAQVYNSAVARLLREATFVCSSVPRDRQAMGFTEGELVEHLAKAEQKRGYRARYGAFVDQFSFAPFGLRPEGFATQETPFTTHDMRWGSFLGVDVGGTAIKFCLFERGERAPDVSGIAQISTFPAIGSIEVGDFCRRIVEEITRWLPRGPRGWEEIDGVGISWPGAVRNNRFAGASGTLRRLTVEGKSFSENDPLARLPEFDFAARFRAELDDVTRKSGIKLKDGFTAALENDGNTEAFGNYCLRAMRGIGGAGGKIFLKLGTSLAGGRITTLGGVAEEIGEFSKLTLDLKAPAGKDPRGIARELVSSLGVRNLTRTFIFQHTPLFGPHGDYAPQKEDTTGRIESVELGQLLPIWQGADLDNTLLGALIETDNRDGGDTARALSGKMLSANHRPQLQAEVRRYVGLRSADAPQGNLFDTPCWVRGLKRTAWLCTGQVPPWTNLQEPSVPDDFPYEAFVRLVLGTAALFSELALRLAHTVAALYNVYRRGTFDEVILSGGVLSGETGPLVVRQASAFMEKYYDKIYGKTLPRGAIKLAGAGDPEITGPLGAAMAANRRHKSQSVRHLEAQLDWHISQLQPGHSLDVVEFLKSHPHRADLAAAVRHLDTRVAQSVLAIRPGHAGTYLRAL